MDLFSTNAEQALNKTVPYDNELSWISHEADIVTQFKLPSCLDFIKNNNLTKVCLQFPDYLLNYSVQIALWLEKHSNKKVYVLADTSYGSCCVDELAAEHIGGDGVIHLGHACLSPTSRLPVCYVLPHAHLDVPQLTSALTSSPAAPAPAAPVLLLYDVAYHHLTDEIRQGVVGEEGVVVSQLFLPDSTYQPCSPTCRLLQGTPTHSTSLLGRAFCCDTPASVVYVAHKLSQNMINFALSLRGIPFFTYSEGKIESVDFNKTFRRRLFLVEKLKDAKTIGILVGTLSVDKYLSAVERVKKLASLRSKRCYVFSVGKPNPAKLANFPEIEVFVLVSCPEGVLEGEKDYMQPVVTLLEVELAFNPHRQWDDKLSVDFRDLLQGGSHHKELPEGSEPLAADVSLISNRIRSELEVEDSGSGSQLSVKEHYQISVASSYTAGRSWRGLEQALGETPVSQAVAGRSGIAMAYEGEKAHQSS